MRRPDLLPDCGSCAAVCCVAIRLERSDFFACDKPAGARCAHLTRDDRCSIHALREQRGFVGCTLYDCYGAGQRVTRLWGRAQSDERDRAFFALREIHELLFLLTEAAKLCPPSAPELRAAIEAQIARLDELRDIDAAALERVRSAAAALLRSVGDVLGGRRQRGG